MNLRLPIILTLLSILISACGGASTPTSEAITPTEENREVPSVQTATPTILSPDDLQLTTNCTVVSRRPTPGPTQQSLFPPVSEQDWVKGSDDAQVTFIEYSDFQ